MSEAPPVHYDPLAWDFYAHAHETYDRLRSADPVHWYAFRREWVLTRQAEVQAVLRDPNWLAMPVQPGVAELEARVGARYPAIHQVLDASIVIQSPPGHAIARKLLARVLNARPFADLAPIIEAKTRALLDHARRQGGFDAVRDFAEPLPYHVIGELLGIPEADLPVLMDNSRNALPLLFELHHTADEYRDLNSRLAVALDFLESLLNERRSVPRADGLTRLLQLSTEDPLLTNRTLAAYVYFLFVVGFETTAVFLAGSILALLEFPEQAQRWRQRAIADELAVEELLRFTTPVHQTIRQPCTDVTLGGKILSRAQPVILLLAAANRDPAVFAHPHQLDLGRAPCPHLAFGDGPHLCLGAALARLEGRLALPLFLELPVPRRATSTLEWLPYELICKFKALPLTWGGRCHTNLIDTFV